MGPVSAPEARIGLERSFGLTRRMRRPAGATRGAGSDGGAELQDIPAIQRPVPWVVLLGIDRLYRASPLALA